MTKRQKAPGTLIYDSWFLLFGFLSDEDAGKVIKAIGDHVRGKPVKLPDRLRESSEDIFAQIDADRRAYDEKCERLRANGKQKGANAPQMLPKCSPKGEQMRGNSKSNSKSNSNVITNVITENIGTPSDKPKPSSARFIPPTLEEIKTYITEKGYIVDAEAFLAFYESNGWKVGKNPMKSWKSALTTWEKRRRELHTSVTTRITPEPYVSNDDIFAELEREGLFNT